MQNVRESVEVWASAMLGDVDLVTVLLNLVLTLVMSQLLAWHYMRFAKVLSNKRKFARTLPFVAVTTLLVINIVSTSLALSLGLVGALSIVRFRTPIKETEELAYLYLAIATGLGMGANEPLITMVVFAALLAYLALQHFSGGTRVALRTVLQVSAPAGAGAGAEENLLGALLPAVEGVCERTDLRRVDRMEDQFHASLLVELGRVEAVSELMTRVRAALPGATVSVIERDALE